MLARKQKRNDGHRQCERQEQDGAKELAHARGQKGPLCRAKDGGPSDLRTARALIMTQSADEAKRHAVLVNYSGWRMSSPAQSNM